MIDVNHAPLVDLEAVWDRVAEKVEQNRQQTAADWQRAEYLLRVVALLAVRCAVACHHIAKTEAFNNSNYCRSNDDLLEVALNERIRRQVPEKYPIVFSADSLSRVTDD